MIGSVDGMSMICAGFIDMAMPDQASDMAYNDNSVDSP